MAQNGIFCADVLRPRDLAPLTDFTYKYRPADSISHLSSGIYAPQSKTNPRNRYHNLFLQTTFTPCSILHCCLNSTQYSLSLNFTQHIQLLSFLPVHFLFSMTMYHFHVTYNSVLMGHKFFFAARKNWQLTDLLVLLHIFTLCTKLSGAVYCNRSCLWVCGCVCGSVTMITRNCMHRSSPN